MKEATTGFKWTRSIFLFIVFLLVVLVGCLLWFGHDDGPDLRQAAYFGDFSKVQSILKTHPWVIDSYRPHPEALLNDAQRKGVPDNKWLRLRLKWAKLRYFLRQVGYHHRETQYDAWDDAGFSPLDLAVEGNHPKIVCLLLDHGADYSHLSAGNMTALNLAIRRARLEIVKQFLAHRCDLETPDRSGSTALCEAVLQQNMEIGELLLAHGAKVDGGTNLAPLQVAAMGNSKAMAELLITHGAQVNITNRWRETPLAIAIRLGNGEVATYLREQGAR